MLDQSFSQENFRIIFDIVNRKGGFEKAFFPPEYLKISEEISKLKSEIGITTTIDEDETAKSTLLAKIDSLLTERDELLDEELMEISTEVNKKEFGFQLKQFYDIKTEKHIYAIGDDKTSFYTMKQLQHNIYRSFKVKQSDRYQIVKQVKTLLQDNFNKYIVRTDIESFYESVSQSRLFEILEGNQLLSPKSNNLIRNLIYHFNDLSGQLTLDKDLRKGVPRGAGVSAYLSELYMRSIDEQIRAIKDVVFYGRYVDDIIIIFTPLEKKDSKHYVNLIREIVNDNGLNLKENKTSQVDAFTDNPPPSSINFLGYRFDIKKKKYAGIFLSENKKLKYTRRLEATVDAFIKDKTYNFLQSKKLLIHRLNYITKNTRLQYPKKGLTGIYYSNSLLETTSPCLDELNKILVNIIDSKLPLALYPELNVRLKRFCFRRGFTEKLFFNITSKVKTIADPRPKSKKILKPSFSKFERIVSVWKS